MQELIKFLDFYLEFVTGNSWDLQKWLHQKDNYQKSQSSTAIALTHKKIALKNNTKAQRYFSVLQCIEAMTSEQWKTFEYL